MCPWVGAKRQLRCFDHIIGGGMCRGHAQYSAFAPIPLLLLQALQKWQVFLVSLYLLSIICPNWACMQLFLVPYNIFCILLLEEWCGQVQALQHCSKGSEVCLSQCLVGPWEEVSSGSSYSTILDTLVSRTSLKSQLQGLINCDLE